MPVLTQNQKAVQFTHVMKELLQRDEATSTTALALQDFTGGSSVYKDVDIILSMTDGDISSLQYETDVPDPSDATKTIKDMKDLPRGEKALLQTLIYFQTWRKNAGQVILPDKWNDITYDEFRDYRINHHWAWLDKRASLGIGPSAQKVGTSTSGSYVTKSPSELFRSTIKKDTSSYPVLKDERSFDDWYRLTKSTASTHDLSDVFNPNYVPAGNEKTMLFKVKQQFVYTFLVRCLQTDKGKSLVRENESDHNAQKIL